MIVSDYIKQGKSHFTQGEYKLALEYFQAASETDPKCKEAYLLQAAVYQAMRNDRLAQSTVYSILVADPTDTNATTYLRMISDGKPLNSIAKVMVADSDVFCDEETWYMNLSCGRVDIELNSDETAFIKHYNGEIKGDLVIPSHVIWDNNSYKVTEIGDRAFEGCLCLVSICIPDSVTSIGYKAFHGCSGLSSVSIGKSMKSIGNSAFSYCSNLTRIVVSKGNRNYNSQYHCNAIIETRTNKLIFGCQATIIHDSVTEIRKWAFEGCSGLTSIRIPDSVTEIGNAAFWNCSDLTSIRIPNSVTVIGNNAFKGCSKLKTIYIKDKKLLKNANVPDGVQIITE